MHTAIDPPTFDPPAVQVLRQVAHWAQSARATLDDLEAGLSAPPREELPPATLRLTPPLKDLLRRAADLAIARNAPAVGVDDLREALAESRAVEAGLDLERLRFTRWWIRRELGSDLRARTYLADDIFTLSGKDVQS